MKYVMFEVVGRGLKQYIPIIFPKFLVHSLMADYMRVALAEHEMTCRPRSAGDVRFGIHVTCYGHSSTLDLWPHEDDASIIEHFDYMHGLGEDDGTADFVEGLIARSEMEAEAAEAAQA